MSAATSIRPVSPSDLVGLSGDVTDQLSGRPWAWRSPGWKAPKLSVLAIDPGNITGWAFLAGGRYVGGSQELPTAGTIWKWIVECDPSPQLVVVEDAYVQRNWVSAMSLARRVGMVVAVAELLSRPVVRVQPSSWQSQVLGKVNRDQGKRLSLEVARRRVHPGIANDHAADAALLALWARGA